MGFSLLLLHIANPNHTQPHSHRAEKKPLMEKILQNSKPLQSTAQCFHHLKQPPSPPQIQNISASPVPAVLNQCLKLSRRELAVCTKSSLLLLITSQFQDLFCLSKARAEEETLLTPEKTEVQQDGSIETKAITSEEPVENNVIENEEKPVENNANTSEENPVEPSTITSEASPIENSSIATEENLIEDKTITSATTTTDGCSDRVLTKRAFLDISIDGQPIGRIVIGLYGNNVPAGTARFSDFVSGAAGISYRRKEFIKITPNYVQHGGVRSYGVDAELAAKTGRQLAADSLIDELERENAKCPGMKNVAGSVGLVVRDPFKPPPKQKLVARGGKLEIDEEEVGKDPNGTEFVIATKDSPELDASTLVVGKVLEGMDVVEKIGQVKTVQENTSSPYFRVAKLIGDKRAVVAERGFNRPYSKVVVTNCGLQA